MESSLLKWGRGKCPFCLEITLGSGVNKNQLVTAVEQNDRLLGRALLRFSLSDNYDLSCSLPFWGNLESSTESLDIKISEGSLGEHPSLSQCLLIFNRLGIILKQAAGFWNIHVGKSFSLLAAEGTKTLQFTGQSDQGVGGEGKRCWHLIRLSLQWVKTLNK